MPATFLSSPMEGFLYRTNKHTGRKEYHDPRNDDVHQRFFFDDKLYKERAIEKGGVIRDHFPTRFQKQGIL